MGGAAALAIPLIAQAIKAGIDLYMAQGMSEQQARELVLRDMRAAAKSAGLAEAGWRARKRPREFALWGRTVTLPAETVEGDVVGVVPGQPIREHIASEDMPTDPTARGPSNPEGTDGDGA